jgi:hypothetical protein
MGVAPPPGADPPGNAPPGPPIIGIPGDAVAATVGDEALSAPLLESPEPEELTDTPQPVRQARPNAIVHVGQAEFAMTRRVKDALTTIITSSCTPGSAESDRR